MRTRRPFRPVRAPRTVGLLLTLGLVLVACGDAGSTDWRDVTVEVPDEWVVFEEAETHLSIANQPLGEDVAQEDAPEDDVVGMFFRHDPGIRPDAWRSYIEDLEDSTMESDESIELDGEVPATRMVFSYVTNDVPTREMVVVIPARDIEVLAQPVPQPGDTDAPEVFMDHVEIFTEVIDGLTFGAPVD